MCARVCARLARRCVEFGLEVGLSRLFPAFPSDGHWRGCVVGGSGGIKRG